MDQTRLAPVSTTPAPSSATLRPFESGDAEAVADLFIEAMRGGKGRANGALVDYLTEHFLRGPFANPDIPSLVAIDAQGELMGFIGATSHRIRIGQDLKTIAIGSTLMVRNHTRDPMIGARLMRALLSGNQAATLSETASERSIPMWKRLGGEALPLSSLDWIRVLRPAAFAIGVLGQRLAPLKWLAPIAGPIDRWAMRRKSDQTWTSLPEDFRARSGINCTPISSTDFVAAVAEEFASSTVKPLYSNADLQKVVEDSLQKSTWGTPHLRAIETQEGKRMGLALYHSRPGGVARLHCLIAAPAFREAALDAVLADVRSGGAAAVMGRSDPGIFEWLSRRRAIFLRTSATVLHTQDQTIREAFHRGDVPLNGLFGERWSRLIDDDVLWS